MNLKPSVAKSAQAGFVHAGEANVEPGWLAAQEQAEGELEMLGAPSAMPLPMRRTVSDQGPQRFEEKGDGQGSRAPSLYSNYSFYSLPAEDRSNPASRQVSPVPSPNFRDNSRFAAQQSQSMEGDEGQSMGTLQKAKAGLKAPPQRTPSGKRPEPESPEDYLRELSCSSRLCHSVLTPSFFRRARHRISRERRAATSGLLFRAERQAERRLWSWHAHVRVSEV
jgi:hypothetical protein